MRTFRHILLEEIQGEHLKDDIISFMYESSMHRKWKTLRHAISKKITDKTYEPILASAAITEYTSKLHAEYSADRGIWLEQSTMTLLEAEFNDKIFQLTEAAEDYRLITAARGIFPRPMISVVKHKNEPVLLILINSKDILRRFLPRTHRVLEKRGYVDLNAHIYVNRNVGARLYQIDENNQSSLVAETDMDGNFPSNALANRLVATLKRERTINKILANLKE